MRAPCSYDYAIIRVVPRVEREEFVNVGVIVSCPALDYLAARRDNAAAVSRRASGARYDQFVAPKQGMSHWIAHLVTSLRHGTMQFIDGHSYVGTWRGGCVRQGKYMAWLYASEAECEARLSQ